tara:strand:- start:234 stop:1289 length:1056 start_codon:yes stop_codon:yes gene_type:complete
MKIFKNKKILITGNTGFKGSWLTLCLLNFKAKIYGFSDTIKTKPSLFKALKLEKKIEQYWGDISNYKALSSVFKKIKPDVVFHLAAQSLVFEGYDKPLNTFKTNIMGTANVVDLIYKYSTKASILITSDKVYENQEIDRGYTEKDILKGVDPYSASKSSAEIIINSYNKSFCDKNVKVVVTRAGNVIGGGDWSPNRIVPDIIDAWVKKKKLFVRNPKSIRPWQHVLEPINAYINLAEALLKKNKKTFNECFNIGPTSFNKKSVKELLILFKKKVNFNFQVKKEKKKYESKLLILNSNKIKRILGWKPKLNFKQTIFLTADWYLQYYKNKQNIFQFTNKQIKNYFKINETKI